MMKCHCDLCDKLTDAYKKWVEITGEDGVRHIFHLNTGDEADLCKSCWEKVLQKNIDELNGRDDDIPF